MKSQEFAQQCRENIGRATYSVLEAIGEVAPSDTIFLSYDLYNKVLQHSSFSAYYSSYLTGVESVVQSTIPGRVMLLKTGHVIVVSGS